MTTVKAQLNGLRIAPRKVRLLARLVKRASVSAAIDQLSIFAKRSAVPLIKLIESAAANAQNIHKLDRSTLVIKELRVDEGLKLKRFRPKGFGRANPIEKKTSRITVILENH